MLLITTKNEKLFFNEVSKLVGCKPEDAWGYLVYPRMRKINIKRQRKTDGEQTRYLRKNLRNT